MLIKYIKALIKIIIIVALVYGVARFVVVFKDSRLTGYRAPYIQMLTSESVIVRWLTEENQLGVIHFGEDSRQMSTVKLEGSPTKNHSVKLTDLKPATKYYYQTGKIESFHAFDAEKHWFYTHPKETVPTRIWVLGDAGEPGGTVNQVRDSALSWMQQNPLVSEKVENNEALINVWISLGDIAYRSGTNDQFQSALFDTFEDVMANTSLWPVYGNHDERRWTYFRIFDLPENAEAGGVASNTENYYAIDYSNIHFVILDSQESDRSVTGEMANWLKQDLAQNTKPWLVVAFHHPPYSKGSHDSDDAGDSRGRMRDIRENILPILEKSGVDLVLSGHSHMYERSYLLDCTYGKSGSFSASNIVSRGINNNNQHYLKPLSPAPNQGAVYMVAGSSSKVDQGPLDHPAHHVGLLEAGSVIIDVNGNTLVARFINNKGQVRDEFSIEKNAEFNSGYQGCK